MTNDFGNLKSWFQTRPRWQQEAVSLLLSKNDLDDGDINVLAKKCIEDASGQTSTTNIDLPIHGITDSSNTKTIRLRSLSNVKGVNALAPRKPLEFGHENLVIIYGGNGSGKSGYVRMLKHSSGDRNKGPLHANVFLSGDDSPSAEINYNKNDQDVTVAWSHGFGVVQDLYDISIYDDGCARLYVEGENEVTYEPPLLTFFSDLISICEHVGNSIENIRNQNISCKPTIPQEYTGTSSEIWYTKIDYNLSSEEVEFKTEWNDEHDKAVADLEQRLAEKSPADKAKELTIKKGHLERLAKLVEKYICRLADDNCRHILSLKQTKMRTQNITQIAAQQLSSISILDGIGSDVWKQMWEYARQYAEKHAYQGQPFPYVGDDSRCVLCHQHLAEDAQHRLISLESFARGQAEKDLQIATKALNDAMAEIGELPTPQSIKTQCDAAGLSYVGDMPQIAQDMLAFKVRAEKLITVNSLDELPKLPNISAFIAETNLVAAAYSDSVAKLLEDAKSDNRVELAAQLKELRAKKWLFEQRDAITSEIVRLKAIDLYDKAKQSTVTTGLSRKKGEISEGIITEAFVARFRHELDQLKASWLKVELAKTKTSQGRVLHGIRLVSVKSCKPSEVLSDGERRVVSLAAFLADVAGKPHKSTFIFDDPVSSLDQEYEEAVAQRLVRLSSDRQVIVFTHRISLLVLLQEYLGKENQKPKMICLKAEPWGTGEPGSPPLYTQKPESALNILLCERLNEAKRILHEHGHDKYAPLAKSICSEFRIVIERIIEFDLLADVIQRFRRAVNTLGKINKLPRISTEDCDLIDTLMTKYSRHEHSQPNETPLPPPTPDDLETDLIKLRDWRKEFIARAA